jgi:hypothetical protein
MIQLWSFTMHLYLCRYNLFLFAFIYMVPLAGMSYCYYRKGLPYTVEAVILSTGRQKNRNQASPDNADEKFCTLYLISKNTLAPTRLS